MGTLGLGGIGLALNEAVYTVDPGHRAVIFDRLSGIKKVPPEPRGELIHVLPCAQTHSRLPPLLTSCGIPGSETRRSTPFDSGHAGALKK